MGASERYVDANGHRFHVLEYGNELDPVLVFLHGVLAAARTYEPMLEMLSAHRRVIAFDQRGHGRTSHADDYSWPRWVEDVHAICEVLDVTRMDLVGHSMGAHNAYRFAGCHPHVVEHLVLVDGGFGPINSPEEDTFWAKLAGLFPAEGYPSRQAYAEVVVGAFPRADRALVETSAEQLAQRADGSWAWPDSADLAVLGAEDGWPTPAQDADLRTAVDCPVLVIRAEHSEMFTGDAYRRIARQYRHGTATELAGSGHMVQWENVPGLAKMIDDFITAEPAL
jgi:esterase